MIKQLIALLVFTVAIVMGMAYAHLGIQLLVNGYNWIADVLTNVFTGGQAGNIIRGLIALLAIPLLVGLIPSIIYWVIRRRWFPYFMEIVWIVWLVQVGALVIAERAVTG